jgi:hypothetical protein
MAAGCSGLRTAPARPLELPHCAFCKMLKRTLGTMKDSGYFRRLEVETGGCPFVGGKRSTGDSGLTVYNVSPPLQHSEEDEDGWLHHGPARHVMRTDEGHVMG